MNLKFDSDVLVVGAGPVGLTLAMDLARNGVKVHIVEVRKFAEPRTLNATMCRPEAWKTFEDWALHPVCVKLDCQKTIQMTWCFEPP